jgi:hypothetical protein
MRSAVNVQQIGRARVPDNRSAVASIRDIGNSINQGLANYTSAKIRDELMDEAAVNVQQPKTPEQRQTEIQNSQIDLAEDQQVSQTQQQAQAKREEITRQATWRDITANPELAKKFMDLQAINPQMAKGVANTLLTRDQVQIEALQKEAVQWNTFTQNVVQMASDPKVSDEQLQSTIKSYAAKQAARGAPIDELANLIGLNRDEMYGWGVKQMTDSNNVYQMVEQSKPFVIGKNDRILNPQTNEVLVDAAQEQPSALDNVKLQIEQTKLKQMNQTGRLTTTEIRGLNNDVGKITGPVAEIHAAATSLGSLKKSGSATDKVAAAFKFMKALDPTSTVRESELDALANSGGPLATVAGLLLQAQGAGGMTDAIFQQIVNTSQTLANSAVESATGELEGYLGAYGERIPTKQNDSFRKRMPSMFSTQEKETMTATNPQTGQTITSSDGGQTWQ